MKDTDRLEDIAKTVDWMEKTLDDNKIMRDALVKISRLPFWHLKIDGGVEVMKAGDVISAVEEALGKVDA